VLTTGFFEVPEEVLSFIEESNFSVNHQGRPDQVDYINFANKAH